LATAGRLARLRRELTWRGEGGSGSGSGSACFTEHSWGRQQMTEEDAPGDGESNGDGGLVALLLRDS
jgi:hypothetical protein